jgi:leader peptidase (prepilin peptidase) / N-methyltransferase
LVAEYVTLVTLTDRLIGAVAGFSALQLIRLAYRKLRAVDGMGGGDPKLLGAIGLWLGWQALPIIVMLASAIGLVAFLFKSGKQSAGTAQLPLGSFLSVAAFIFTLFEVVTGL